MTPKRLTTQQLSNGSYCAIANLMLHKGRRHAVRVRCGWGLRAQIGCNNQIEDNVDGGSSLALYKMGGRSMDGQGWMMSLPNR